MLCEEECMSLAKALRQTIRIGRTATFYNRVDTFLGFLLSPSRKGRVRSRLF